MAFAFLSSLYGDFMQAVGASVRMFEVTFTWPAGTAASQQQIMDRIPAINTTGGSEPEVWCRP